ncbi:hypothetical protein BKA70DRAFT_1423426 [Coprinopsis sp. MPI-PUGE-AT-0042]|nr:hypothetical protein BKA70DRAFT_1423426 [Coprinopsis sp. MPI-PUGE-AT-0042]
MFRRDSLTLPRYKPIRVQPSPSELSEHLRPLLNGYQPEVPLPWWFARDVLSSQIPSPIATPSPGVTPTDSSQFAKAPPSAEPMRRQQSTLHNLSHSDEMVHAMTVVVALGSALELILNFEKYLDTLAGPKETTLLSTLSHAPIAASGSIHAVSSIGDDAPLALRSSTSATPEASVCDSLQPAGVEAETDLGVVDQVDGHLGHIIVEFTLSSLLSSDTLHLSTSTVSGGEDEGATCLNHLYNPPTSYIDDEESKPSVSDTGKDNIPVPPSPDIPTIPSEDSVLFSHMSRVYDGLPYTSDSLPIAILPLL